MHPIQPIVDGRFVENKIVTALLATSTLDMNALAVMEFSNEDREQFAQLIGYSLSSFSELSYVSDEVYDTAEILSERGGDECNTRNAVLRKQLREICRGLSIAAVAAFNLHPDDLGA